MRKYHRVRNPRMIQFFESYGVSPAYEEYKNAYYKRTPAFLELLEKYYIRYNCFPNRVAK